MEAVRDDLGNRPIVLNRKVLEIVGGCGSASGFSLLVLEPHAIPGCSISIAVC